MKQQEGLMTLMSSAPPCFSRCSASFYGWRGLAVRPPVLVPDEPFDDVEADDDPLPDDVDPRAVEDAPRSASRAAADDPAADELPEPEE